LLEYALKELVRLIRKKIPKDQRLSLLVDLLKSLHPKLSE